MFKRMCFAILVSAIGAVGIAHAADTTKPLFVKAAPVAYQFDGTFFGGYTEAGGGPVVASAPGINPASLTTTSAAIGLTAGYAHRFSNGLVGTIEADVCAKNFNGSNAGFSLSGPLCFEQRAMVFAPTDVVMNALSFLSIPNVFANLAAIMVPSGQTITTSYLGVGAGAYWNDMTVAYNGVGANKVWAVNPELVIMKMDLITNHTMLRSFAKIDLESQTAVFGVNQSTARVGVGGRAGLGFAF